MDSQGLVRVSSSLLYSPSESEWLSCIVSLSDKWKTEGRILPTLPSGDSIEGFTVNQVLLFVLSVSLVINFICGLYFFIGFKRNGFKCSSVHKSRKNKENIQEGQKMEETTLIEVNNQEGQKIEDLLQGKRLTSLKREHFTMDPKTASSAIRLSHINKKIQYLKTKDKSNPQMSLHVLGNKGFDSGQHYWQVTVKEDNKNEKLAWYLGVTRENVECSLTPENGFWILFFEKGELGLHVYVDNVLTSIGQKTPTIMGVFLDCDKHTLSFYDAKSEFLLYTFNDVKTTNTLYPVFSPGNKDAYPIGMTDPSKQKEDVHSTK